MKLDVKKVREAQTVIRGVADNTPLIPSFFLSSIIGHEFLLKLENMQPIGAFKIRGALNAIFNLPMSTKVVTCCSTGNHGRGIAYAAAQRGIKAVVFMSNLVPKVKIEVVIDDAMTERVVDAIQNAAQTGRIGDGKIFISAIDEAIRIRTGERGSDAV